MIYITFTNINDSGYIGIKKKILAQIDVFKKYNENVYYTTYSGQMYYLMNGEKVIEKGVALTRNEIVDDLIKWIEKYNIKNSYIRYDLSDIYFIELLKKLKDINVKTIVEFPTIPYEKELKSKRLLNEDSYYREQIKLYIEQVTTYSNDKQVFGISAIQLQNGVKLSEHPVHKLRDKDGSVRLIAVASGGIWHGYERVIKGLANYYANNPTVPVYFTMVGEKSGTEISKYIGLTKRLGLEEYVCFAGKKIGKDLDELYDKSDIAIGTLGMYKVGVTSGSPIKLREYCSRGIPFVYAYDDTSFAGNEEYLLKFPNDSSDIDIEQIIDFFDKIIKNNGYRQEMRLKAENELTWDKILDEVNKYYEFI